MIISEQELIVHSQSDMIITAIFSKWVKITMCKSMAGSRRTQLTLFDCVKHTQEQEEESDRLEREQVHSKRRNFEADPDSLTPERQVPSINDHQTNYITVENPSAPTTIVLNTSGAPVPLASLTTAQGDSSSMVSTPIDLPGDIAPSPQFQPVQLVNLKFPVTLFSKKPSVV